MKPKIICRKHVDRPDDRHCEVCKKIKELKRVTRLMLSENEAFLEKNSDVIPDSVRTILEDQIASERQVLSDLGAL